VIKEVLQKKPKEVADTDMDVPCPAGIMHTHKGIIICTDISLMATSSQKESPYPIGEPLY
jgi:hypothetical protein